MLSFGELPKKMQNYFKRLLKYDSLFQLYIYARPDFHHKLQLKHIWQQIKDMCRYKNPSVFY